VAWLDRLAYHNHWQVLRVELERELERLLRDQILERERLVCGVESPMELMLREEEEKKRKEKEALAAMEGGPDAEEVEEGACRALVCLCNRGGEDVLGADSVELGTPLSPQI
jgi:hypothetical protein